MMTFADDLKEFKLEEGLTPKESIELWADRFIENLRSKRRSEKTIRAYRAGLKSFVGFIEMHNMSLSDISTRFINRYLMHIQYSIAQKSNCNSDIVEQLKRENDIKNPINLGKNDSVFTIVEKFQNTLALRIKTVKSLLRFISDNNSSEHDYISILKGVAVVKIDDKITDYLTIREIDDVLAFLQEWTKNYKKYSKNKMERIAYRNSFLVALYALTGARSEEIINVRLSDIKPAKLDGKKGYVINILKGKGGKRRKVFAPKKQIDFYLDYMSSELPNIDYYISSSYKEGLYTNKPIATNYIREFSNFALGAIGISKSGLHIFRRGYVTRRIGEDKIDASLVAKEVGNTIAILEKHYLKHEIGINQ